MTRLKPLSSKRSGRRQLIGALTLSGAALAKALPEQWTRPVVSAVVLPAHAQTSEITQITPPPAPLQCAIQGPNTITALGMANILLTITPNPGIALPIQAIGSCNGNLVFNVTSTLDFTTGQSMVSIGPLAPPPTCNPGDTLTVTLTAPTLGGITTNCDFDVI